MQTRTGWIIGLGGITLTLDRLLKVLALRGVEHDLFGGISFSLIRNRGVAFSFPIPGALATTLIGLLLIGLIVVILQRVRHHQTWYGWGLIVTGGVSNLFDRLRYGSVIDYLRASNGAINLADVLIVVGIFFLVRRELTGLVRRRYTRQ